MSSSERHTVGDLAAALERSFPAAWAEEWDNVGLVIGESPRPVTGVLVTLDATAEAVERASEAGANVLVTHHPPYLEMPARVEAGPGPAGTLEAALRLGVAVLSLHTNLDRSPRGAEALADALGLGVLEPLERSTERVTLVVTYAPSTDVERLRHVMAAAGAGRIGAYEECAFVSSGTGYFTPRADADPAVGGGEGGVDELRLEMVARPSSAAAVIEAARAAHPYEEPVVLAFEGTRARGAARMGRLCAWQEGASLRDLAAHVSSVLGSGCRVWGDPDAPAGRIAVGNGSVGSLVLEALTRADTLLGGEVRYHDALAAASAGLQIIEAGHDATEWPMVAVLEQAIRAWAPGIHVVAEMPKVGWWMMEGADDRR